MSYSPLVPLISVSVLYENNLKEQQVFEQEVVTRWMSILTREHIEEKIKAALKSGKQSAILIDEQFDMVIDDERMFRQPMIPYEMSVHQHIQSLLDDKDNIRVSRIKKDRCVLIRIAWGDPFVVTEEEHACIQCTLCSFCLCCMCGMCCSH